MTTPLVEHSHSNFPLVRKLNNQTAAHVLNLLSEHDIPAYLFTDHGSQFTSAEFQEFARCYQVQILHSTSRHPHYNGFIKVMVKVVKQNMSKAEQSVEGPHLEILAYRVTPRGPGKLSPAEAITQHKFRALLPIKQHLSAQLTISREIMLQQKQQWAEHYNCTAQLQEFQQYQPVQVQLNLG